MTMNIIAHMQKVALEFAKCQLPSYMWKPFEQYYLNGIEPGSFLYHVLSNNLMMSFEHADDVNQRSMLNWCTFIWNGPVGASHGSKEWVNKWIKQGGLKGLHNEDQRNRRDAPREGRPGGDPFPGDAIGGDQKH